MRPDAGARKETEVMLRPKWLRVSSSCVALAAGTMDAVLSAPAQEQHATSPVPAHNTGDSLFAREDLEFLSHMILHHEQALELAALVPTRTNRDELIRFARYVDSEQRAEIEQMKTLLRLAADRGAAMPDPHAHDDPPMAGMLSRGQMAAIASASGAEFERRWLEGMILHHEGALDMARAQQQRQFESRRRPFGIDVLVDDILVVQRAEITKMRSMLGD